MKISKLESKFIIDEPGDGTRYTWLITPALPYADLVQISDCYGLFATSRYRREEICSYMKQFPELARVDIPTNTYQASITEEMLSHYLISEMVSKADCFPTTAIAAIRAAYMVI